MMSESLKVTCPSSELPFYQLLYASAILTDLGVDSDQANLEGISE